MAGSWGHTVHAAVVLAGLLALAALLRPDPAALAVGRLRRDAAQGRLVEAALERVKEQAAPVAAHPLVAAAAVASVAAAWVHATAAGMHLSSSPAWGAAFALLAVAQTAWAVAALRSPGRLVLVAGACGHALVALGWLVTRTTGLPGVPAAPVGALDVVATSYELAVVGCCLAAARSCVARPARLAPRERRAAVLATAGTVLLALAGL